MAAKNDTPRNPLDVSLEGHCRAGLQIVACLRHSIGFTKPETSNLKLKETPFSMPKGVWDTWNPWWESLADEGEHAGRWGTKEVRVSRALRFQPANLWDPGAGQIPPVRLHSRCDTRSPEWRKNGRIRPLRSSAE